jgi:hypothetical protein
MARNLSGSSAPGSSMYLSVKGNLGMFEDVIVEIVEG